MRPNWPGGSEDAELEALQTDVMRFVAILGLCLAAIFSLVQQASLEPLPMPQPDPSHQPTGEREPPPVTRADTVQPSAPDLQRQRSTPAGKKAPTADPVKQVPEAVEKTAMEPQTTRESVGRSEEGFSLEFESTSAMMSLLESRQLRLYVQAGEHFWEADHRGRFSRVAAPSHYYEMDNATVPRKMLQTQLATSGQTAKRWGVDLSGPILKQITDTTRSATGGTILIQADGRVRLDDGS